MKRTIYLVLVLFSASANEIITRSSTVQLLDCVNFREYTLSGLSDLKSLMYRPLTFTTDTMESNIEKDTTSFRPQLSVLADLSSETGEPLFLRVTGGDSRNREHGTFGRVTLTVPKIHTQISGSYRHLGMYADRTEDFCTSYEQHRGSALPHRDMGHYGVAEYIIGKISSEIRRVSSKTTINRYGEWMVIPGLYNPLYKKGNAVSQSLKIPFNRNLLSLNGMADQRVLYTGHNSTVKKMYYDVQASYNRELFSSDSLSVNLHLSNEKNYGDHFGVQFSHFAAIYNLSVTAGIWSAGMPDANVRFAVPFLDSSDVSLGYSFVYIPEEASIPQTTPLNVVTTRIDPLHYNQVRLSTNVRHCFRTPLSIELWTDYKSAYQTYSVDSTRDTLSTRFTGSDEPVAAGGGAIKMVQTFKHVSLRALCAGTVNFTGEPFEYVPFECGAGFSCFFGSSSMIRTDFDVTLRGPAKWNASYLGKDSTISSPQILFCNFGITIPFILPVLASHITPELAIKAGPISFRPSGRQQYHPFGGPLGPLVSATLLGTIK